MAAKQVQQKVSPGAFFGAPGMTRWTYQQENNYGLATTESSGGATGSTNITPPLGIIPFYQTDVAFGWKVQIVVAQSGNSAGAGGTVNQSPQGFYNLLNNFKLTVNKLYNPIDVYSSYDLCLYNFYRPMLGNNINGSGALYTSPVGFPLNPATSPFTASPNNFTAASQTIPMEWPVSIWLDEYFNLDMNGNVTGMAHRLPISPMYMSGEARVVQPSWQYASILAANADLGPFVKSGAFTTQPTVNDTFTLQVNRQGIYASNNLSTMPPVYPWRPSITSRQYSPINFAQVKIPLRVALNPGGGQLLSLMVRLFDPTLNSNIGAPVPLANVSSIQLSYGSGIVRFFDSVTDMRQRFMDQHNVILPDGIIAYDLAIDDRQRLTNARALNMYLTDVFLQINFSSAPSSSAYAVITAETLTFVIDNVAAASGVAAV